MSAEFADTVKQLREKASPTPWTTDHWDNKSFMATYGIRSGETTIAVACNCDDCPDALDADWDLIVFLANHAAKIETLARDAERLTKENAHLRGLLEAGANKALVEQVRRMGDCGCIEGNDMTLTTHAVCNCPVHGDKE